MLLIFNSYVEACEICATSARLAFLANLVPNLDLILLCLRQRYDLLNINQNTAI